MSWWGDPWPSAEKPYPICSIPADQVAFPPPGSHCALCGYEIKPGDAGSTTTVVWPAESVPASVGYAHKECSLRGALGNHIHVRGLCSEVGDCNRLSKLDYRSEALAVWQYVVVEGQEPVSGV